MLIITFTGNRGIRSADVLPILERVYEMFPDSTWRSGMAVGLDTTVAQFAIDNGITLEAHLPFPPNIQTRRWNNASRDKYRKILDADVDVFIHSSSYSDGGYMIRNIKMAEGSDIVIAFNRKKSGGTMNMIRHCIKSGIIVIDGFDNLNMYRL